MTHCIDDDVLLLTADGYYTTDELRRAIDDGLTASTEPIRALVIDLTRSTSLAQRSADDVDLMAAFLASIASRYGKRLIMVASGELAYGLMRMGTVLADSRGVDAEVVTTVELARNRLQLP